MTRVCPICLNRFSVRNNFSLTRGNLTCGKPKCTKAQKTLRQRERRFIARQRRIAAQAVLDMRVEQKRKPTLLPLTS